MHIPRAIATIASCVALVSPAATLAQPQSCATPNHRAFDFWVGEWQVHTPSSKSPSASQVTKELGGCAIRERMDMGQGHKGESLTVYDEWRGIWHQTWVDTGGQVLILEGRLRDGKMILEGETKISERSVISHRITWTPNSDGTVRQLWETLSQSGELKVVFDGKYTRK